MAIGGVRIGGHATNSGTNNKGMTAQQWYFRLFIIIDNFSNMFPNSLSLSGDGQGDRQTDRGLVAARVK